LPETRRIGRRNVVKRLQAIDGEPGRSVYADGQATFEREGETLTVRPAFGMSHELTYDKVRCGPCIEALECDVTVGVMLVRLGGYAMGVFVGDRLESSKVGTRLVHGRHRAGGSSSNRFRRRRGEQAAVLHESAAATAARILLPWVDRLDAVVLGGDREAVRATLAERADLAPVAALAQARFLAVPDPRLRVLQALPYELYAAEVTSTEP
jgi:hypothetical protein